MPTTRPRYLVTETDELAAALDIAAVRWPELSRSQLLVKLALSAVAPPSGVLERRERRLAAARQLAGSVSYPPDYLAELRKDWPE